ncbi:hypothetical protein Tco_0185365 [Tanacetum coccineum]
MGSGNWPNYESRNKRKQMFVVLGDLGGRRWPRVSEVRVGRYRHYYGDRRASTIDTGAIVYCREFIAFRGRSAQLDIDYGNRGVAKTIAVTQGVDMEVSLVWGRVYSPLGGGWLGASEEVWLGTNSRDGAREVRAECECGPVSRTPGGDRSARGATASLIWEDDCRACVVLNIELCTRLFFDCVLTMVGANDTFVLAKSALLRGSEVGHGCGTRTAAGWYETATNIRRMVGGMKGRVEGVPAGVRRLGAIWTVDPGVQILQRSAGGELVYMVDWLWLDERLVDDHLVLDSEGGDNTGIMAPNCEGGPWIDDDWLQASVIRIVEVFLGFKMGKSVMSIVCAKTDLGETAT